MDELLLYATCISDCIIVYYGINFFSQKINGKKIIMYWLLIHLHIVSMF